MQLPRLSLLVLLLIAVLCASAPATNAAIRLANAGPGGSSGADGPLLNSPLDPPLDPPTRAIAFMAILGIVLLGLLLVAVTMIGGRWLRRINRERVPTREWPHRSRPGDVPPEGFGHPPAEPNAPAGKTGDTLTQPPREDTRAD